MIITLDHFLFLGAIMFTIGVLGIFLNKKIVVRICEIRKLKYFPIKQLNIKPKKGSKIIDIIIY